VRSEKYNKINNNKAPPEKTKYKKKNQDKPAGRILLTY